MLFTQVHVAPPSFDVAVLFCRDLNAVRRVVARNAQTFTGLAHQPVRPVPTEIGRGRERAVAHDRSRAAR